jgi:hypothetical protein
MGCFLLALLDMKGVILFLKYQFKFVNDSPTLFVMISLCVGFLFLFKNKVVCLVVMRYLQLTAIDLLTSLAWFSWA